MNEKSAIKITIEQSWRDALSDILTEEYMHTLSKKVRSLYLDGGGNIYPEPKNLFRAFDTCPFNEVSVVILGQDPYHGAGQAHGLSFSVPEGRRPPPSLQNIFKEIQNDVGVEPPQGGDLTHWAQQGVFLLNAILTVAAGQPASHRGLGWERFTDEVIRLLSERREHLVFMLWGSYARQKQGLIDSGKHLVLTAPHPSPFSAANGFFGCRHFSSANAYLREYGKQEVVW